MERNGLHPDPQVALITNWIKRAEGGFIAF